MIQEDYVSFEIAKLLKEKGFDWECLNWYSTKGNLYHYADSFEEDLDGITELCSAPTLQMAMKWLREVHNIFLKVGFGIDYAGDFLFMADIYDLTNDAIDGKYVPTVEADDYLTENPKTYEQAVEAAIKYCLTNLI